MASRKRADHSVLKRSIETNTTGMKQAMLAMKTGSPEVIDVLLNECNLIYECKVCFNMFRSLANLIAHKRTYCKSRCQTVQHHFNNGGKQSKETVETLVMVEPEPVETVYPEDNFELEDYSPSIELLKDAGIMAEIEERPIIESLKPVSNHSKSKLQDIVKKLITVRNAQESEDEKNPLILEPIRQTSRAMFQNHGRQDIKTMGQRYAELVKARQLASVFVGPDNKIIDPGRSKRSFSPASSVESGRITFKSRPAYPNAKFPCTQCDSSYTRLYSVVNHLIKVHDFSDKEAQAEKPAILKKSRNLKKEPKIILSRLTKSQIEKWTTHDQNWNYFDGGDEIEVIEEHDTKMTEFNKLATESLNMNLKICLPRLSPSKFLPSKRSRSASPSASSSTSMGSYSSSSKSSRSASPSASSTSSSSKEENIFSSAPKRPRNSSPQPRRSVLTAKVDQENKPMVKTKRYLTRRAGPASAIKNRELKQLLMDTKP